MTAFPSMALIAFFARGHYRNVVQVLGLSLFSSNSLTGDFSSASAHMKLVPLSENNSSGTPLRLAIL